MSRVVYPALADLAPTDWARAHVAHSRRIGPLVGVVYPTLAITLTGRLITSPDRPALLAAAASALAVALTAGVAAPLHARLGRGPDPALLRRLRQVDRGRTALALAALAAAATPPGRAGMPLPVRRRHR